MRSLANKDGIYPLWTLWVVIAFFLFGGMALSASCAHELKEHEARESPQEEAAVRALFPWCPISPSTDLLIRAWVVACPHQRPVKVLTWGGRIKNIVD